ncbi:MAG: hypothetical protein IKC41_03915 [Clostridia bacterium]|nr:hypothetical protein [Clostridia bacterium]
MRESILMAWETVFKRFYCEETKLLYDYVTDVAKRGFDHLPTPEEIAVCLPNPRGWGTGMEDSALNGSCLLEALLSAYALCKDQKLKALAKDIAEGLLSLEQKGFVARSISPKDKKSFYPESSRDQYTHYVYALFSYFKSELCDAEIKEKIKDSLVRIAKKCERDITTENDFQMLRFDGKIGIVGKMWGAVSPHEWLRLPMFYMAAYQVSGDKHFKELYESIVHEALENSFLPMKKMRSYCLLQMQYSMRLIFDCTDDDGIKTKLMSLMRKNAEIGEKTSLKNSAEYMKPEHKQEIAYRFRKFDALEPIATSIEHGVQYYNTAQSERWEENPAFYPVRGVAEGAMMALLCPDFKKTKELLTAVENMADAIDYDNHYSVYAPLLLTCAYISCKEKGL